MKNLLKFFKNKNNEKNKKNTKNDYCHHFSFLFFFPEISSSRRCKKEKRTGRAKKKSREKRKNKEKEKKERDLEEKRREQRRRERDGGVVCEYCDELFWVCPGVLFCPQNKRDIEEEGCVRKEKERERERGREPAVSQN